MNKQRKVLVTITYNEMGTIIDTKAEEVAQPNLQLTCNQLATDCISRQAAIEAMRTCYDTELKEYDNGDEYINYAQAVGELKNLPSVSGGGWIPCSERMPETDEDGYSEKVLVCFDKASFVEICEYRITDGVGRWFVGDMDDSPEDVDLSVIAWMPLPEPYRAKEDA